MVVPHAAEVGMHNALSGMEGREVEGDHEECVKADAIGLIALCGCSRNWLWSVIAIGTRSSIPDS